MDLNSGWLGVLASWPVKMLMTVVMLACVMIMPQWKKLGAVYRVLLVLILATAFLYFVYLLVFRLI